MKTYRFWDYVNGDYCRLTIREGQTLRFGGGGPCDEGYSYTYCAYWIDGDWLYSTQETSARDCDGRSDTRATHRCHIGRLTRRMPLQSDPDSIQAANGQVLPVRLPGAWYTVRHDRRDYAAEAAGY